MPEPPLRRVVTSVSAADGPMTTDRVAVLLGAKGGVGASSSALDVARELATQSPRSGVAVLLVDAHPSRQDLSILARNQHAMPPSVAMTTAVRLGVRPTLGEGPSAVESVRRLLRAVRRWIDHDELWAVVDAGVADHRWGRELLLRANRPLLVTTPDDPAVVNAYAALKRVPPVVARCGVFVNRCRDQAQADATHESVRRSCKRFLGVAPTLAGWFPTRRDDQLEAKPRAAA